MRADVIKGVIGTIDIKDRDALSLNLDTGALTRWNIAGRGDLDKIAHAVLLTLFTGESKQILSQAARLAT
jgi:hypothetical protein